MLSVIIIQNYIGHLTRYSWNMKGQSIKRWSVNKTKQFLSYLLTCHFSARDWSDWRKYVVAYTVDGWNGGQLGRQSVACWLGHTSRMGLLPVFGSCLPRKQKTGGLLVLQAVGWRLNTFSVAHRKPRTPVYSEWWCWLFVLFLQFIRQCSHHSRYRVHNDNWVRDGDYLPHGGAFPLAEGQCQSWSRHQRQSTAGECITVC